ncbi:hypothetical protein M9H77_02275 [Catharanthus roseus]|uniref:Uncharacterized protein n=1 Tax=Catharanthus roseus TaxID=4058 RepID=A0ACC0C8C3_CATRO|nr:hypothetical protein M9H77_02275 [Catharanthus roseus]
MKDVIMQELQQMRNDIGDMRREINNLSIEHRCRSNIRGHVTPHTHGGYKSHNPHVPHETIVQNLNGWIEKDEEDFLEDLVDEKDNHDDEVIGNTTLDAEEDSLSLPLNKFVKSKEKCERKRVEKMN